MLGKNLREVGREGGGTVREKDLVANNCYTDDKGNIRKLVYRGPFISVYSIISTAQNLYQDIEVAHQCKTTTFARWAKSEVAL